MPLFVSKRLFQPWHKISLSPAGICKERRVNRYGPMLTRMVHP